MASLPSPPLLPAVLPPVAQPLQVNAVTAVAPAALLQADMDALPLPASQPLAPAAAPQDTPDGAAMRPDQAVMARQLTWPSQDGGALAGAWRGLVRNYGAQLANRELQARTGALPAALLLGGQPGVDGRVLRQADLAGTPADAWRFTIHAGGPRGQHLRVVQDEPQPQKEQRRRRARAALRLELVLPDGALATVQVTPLADGVGIELCAAQQRTVERLRELQPQLEAAVRRAGLRVLGWTYRDTLPGGAHARLPSAEAASALSLPVFRAVAELALLLPAPARDSEIA